MSAVYQATRDIPIATLQRFPGNARRGSVADIQASIRRHGQYRSLVVREHDGTLTIIAGNHTRDALEAEGHDTARCEVITCTDDEARRINLADNRLAELGGYDDDDLAALLASLDGDFDGTGWAQDDLDALLGTEPEGNGDPDDVPEPPAEPVTRSGDLYQLGPHRLLCGDSTDMAAVEEMLDGDRCDCMWTDPPYGVDYVGKTKDALTIRNDGADDLAGLLAGAFAVATAALKADAAVYIAYPARHRQTFDQAMTGAGWHYSQELIWVKDVMVLGRTDYHYRHEGILFGYTSGPGTRRMISDGWYGDNSQTSVFEIPKPSRSEDHPTMKPVELVTAMLANSCPPKGLVYEPFGGSGSTLIAAHRLRLSARVVELDPRYCDVICQRYRDYTGDEPVLLESGGL